jgi:paraquat-inducible protein A
MQGIARSGLQAGLVACHACGLLARPVARADPGHCPRCGKTLEWRHHHAIQRTWALLIAAAILYAPANLLPVLTTNTLVSSQSDTIMSGVIFLYTSGSWPLALIVLVASVMIPLGKMSVAPGPGVVYFMGVVVLTMFAAQSFDPRLIWDAAQRKIADGRS